MPHPNVRQALKDLQAGKMIIIADDVDRENEGDLVVAAEHITAETMTFIIKKASGLVCVALAPALAQHFELSPMVQENQESMRTAFTVSVDAKRGISTGISAADRVVTLRLLTQPQATAADLVKPGHIFPLIARPGGLRERRGHTEASVEMVVRAGLHPAAVICEIIGDDGAMVRGHALETFARQHALCLVTVDEITAYVDANT